MDAYIYAADVYCDACGESIRNRITSEGHAPADPDDEGSYDSGEFPKGPEIDGGGEADSPNHCGAGPRCLNAIELDGHKVGAFLENPLTPEGERYVQELHRDDPSEVTALWMEHYELEPLPEPSTLARSRQNDDERQPEWELVANLGDVDPITYGGFVVYRDKRGVYPPEADLIEGPPETVPITSRRARWTVYQIVCDPVDDPDDEWYGDDLDIIADAFEPPQPIRSMLQSDDPAQLASAYQELVSYHGAYEFDQDPLTLTLAEVKARYPEFNR